MSVVAEQTLNCLVRFLPLDFTVEAHPGDTVLDAALDHGIDLPHECGGNCACTTCKVVVQEGMEHLSSMEEAEADRLATEDCLPPHARLGCQALLRGGSVTVALPDELNSE